MAQNRKYIPEIALENARIIFKNFRGASEKFNPEGKRNFGVIIPEEIETQLIDDGWNIKHLQPRDEDDTGSAYLQVAVSYDYYPPAVYMIAGGKKTLLDSDTIDMLDRAEMENVDLVITPYLWEMSGKTGVKAYLKEMYVTIKVSRFADKYADL
ncbi:MAG: hypothetical protein J6X94_03435 [Lachnospiraceae bacterium]|nr:hypothetical protein [Lachnospiraceae bacterium]